MSEFLDHIFEWSPTPLKNVSSLNVLHLDEVCAEFHIHLLKVESFSAYLNLYTRACFHDELETTSAHIRRRSMCNFKELFNKVIDLFCAKTYQATTIQKHSKQSIFMS